MRFNFNKSTESWPVQNLDLLKVRSILKKTNHDLRKSTRRRRFRRSISVTGSAIRQSVKRRRSVFRDSVMTHHDDNLNQSLNDSMEKISNVLKEIDYDKKISENQDYINYI